MTTIRQFKLDDLLVFNNVNLDVLTETYNMPFYMTYMSQWPESFFLARSPSNKIMGYCLGKAEGEGKLWHGHVSAVTVSMWASKRIGASEALPGVTALTLARFGSTSWISGSRPRSLR